MVEQDTVRLLRECNAGIKMGVSAIDECYGGIESRELRVMLDKSRREHEHLGNMTRELLNSYDDEGKEPSVIAKGMSWMKTNAKLAGGRSDANVADLITDGCNTGAKSLSRYLNQYAAADEKSKDITKKLIALEDSLSKDLRDFL